MTYTVVRSPKELSRQLEVPYICCFCVGALVSATTLVTKIRLFIRKLRSRRQDEDAWRSGVEQDRGWARAWLGRMATNTQVYSSTEERAFADALPLLDMFRQQNSSEQETMYHAPSRRLIGKTTLLIHGATAAEVAAYLMNANSCHRLAVRNPAVEVRNDIVAEVNDHHLVFFSEMRSVPLFQNRTFLNSLMCKKILDDPPTWVWLCVPLDSHERVRVEDERHAVRAQVFRCFRLTAQTESVTRLEYVCWLDLGGSFPTFLVTKVALPRLMQLPYDAQTYFVQTQSRSLASKEQDVILEITRLSCAVALGIFEGRWHSSLAASIRRGTEFDER